MSGDLSAFASKLAEAIRRRHALDELAAVPVQVLRHAEGEILAAEADLADARTVGDGA
jgi:hypothetical protein